MVLCPRHHKHFYGHSDTNGTKRTQTLSAVAIIQVFILHSCVSAPLVNCSQAIKTCRISASSRPNIRNSPVTRSAHSHRLHRRHLQTLPLCFPSFFWFPLERLIKPTPEADFFPPLSANASMHLHQRSASENTGRLVKCHRAPQKRGSTN